jgi:hypothetical protein
LGELTDKAFLLRQAINNHGVRRSDHIRFVPLAVLLKVRDAYALP